MTNNTPNVGTLTPTKKRFKANLASNTTNTSDTVTSAPTSTMIKVDYLLGLEAYKLEVEKIIDELNDKCISLEKNIDWDNKRPWAKIKRWGLYTVNNWDDILAIIKIVIKLVKVAKTYGPSK